MIDGEDELRAAHAAIWSRDELTGWPEWDAHEDHVFWGDGDGVAQTFANCMHAHGDAPAYARYIAAADPTVLHDLLTELDQLRAAQPQLVEVTEELPGASPQVNLVWAATHDGGWYTIAHIARRTDIPETSVSARLRELREPRHGFTVQTKPIQGVFFYRVLRPGAEP